MGTDHALIEEVQRCRRDEGLSLVHIAAESGVMLQRKLIPWLARTVRGVDAAGLQKLDGKMRAWLEMRGKGLGQTPEEFAKERGTDSERARRAHSEQYGEQP